MLILYYKPTCQYCRKVLKFAEENNIEFDLRDIIEDPANAAALIDHGGELQVPYLIDDEKSVAIYESEDIIKYLQDTYVH